MSKIIKRCTVRHTSAHRVITTNAALPDIELIIDFQPYVRTYVLDQRPKNSPSFMSSPELCRDRHNDTLRATAASISTIQHQTTTGSTENGAWKSRNDSKAELMYGR